MLYICAPSLKCDRTNLLAEWGQLMYIVVVYIHIPFHHLIHITAICCFVNYYCEATMMYSNNGKQLLTTMLYSRSAGGYCVFTCCAISSCYRGLLFFFYL